MVWVSHASNDDVVGQRKIMFSQALAETYRPELAIVFEYPLEAYLCWLR